MSLSAATARACLLGLAVGDALGAPLRGLRAGHVTQLFGDVSGFTDARSAWEDKPHRWTLPGLHGDETQQALSLVSVLCDAEGIDAARVANLWRRMAFERRDESLRHGAHRGITPEFARTLTALREGKGPTAQTSPSAEPAARVAPLGLVFAADPAALSHAVIEVTLITHRDPRAIAGALAMAHAVALIIRAPDPVDLNPSTLMEELTERVQAGEERLLIDHLGELHMDVGENDADPIHAVSRSLGSVGGLAKERDDGLAETTLIRQANHLAPSRPVRSVNDGSALVTVPAALHFALAHRGFAEPVCRLVAQGRHADTAAAIAGALLGARLGEEAIPAEWREGLIARDLVIGFAEALAGERAEMPDLVGEETALTQRECEARRPLIATAARRRAHDERRAATHPKRVKPKRAAEPETPPFAPPPQTYLDEAEDPEAKRRARAARGKRRIAWKDDRRRGRDR